MKPRENPFRVDSLHQLPFVGTELENLSSLTIRLQRLQYRAAIVGPHGSGKTTLLLEMIQELQRQGHLIAMLRLHDDPRRQRQRQISEWLDQADPHAILCLDGAGLVDWWCWKRVHQQAASHAGLVATLHRPGRLPTLCNCRTSPALLLSLVQQLAPEFPLSPNQAETLFSRHRGNIRDCFRELYDLCSHQ